MALRNRIDPQHAATALTTWFDRNHPESDGVHIHDVTIPAANGMSCETILFDVSWHQECTSRQDTLVARVAPQDTSIFPTYDLSQDAAVMAVARRVVPVPDVLTVVEDPATFGAPFLLMQRCAGNIPADDPPYTASGWVHDLTADQRRRLFDNSLQVLVNISHCETSDLPAPTLGHPSRGAPSMRQHLNYWKNFYRWAASGRSHPVIESGLAWIDDHQPDSYGPDVLSWGDARVGNLVFGTGLEVSGVLDWEMASIGPAELDLCWFILLNRFYSEGIGLPLPTGFLDRDATLTRYEELGGRRIRHLEFFENFAYLRGAIINMRMAYMMIDAGLLPADTDMPHNNPATNLLAHSLRPETGITTADFITGHR